MFVLSLKQVKSLLQGYIKIKISAALCNNYILKQVKHIKLVSKSKWSDREHFFRTNKM